MCPLHQDDLREVRRLGANGPPVPEPEGGGLRVQAAGSGGAGVGGGGWSSQCGGSSDQPQGLAVS